MQPRLVLLTGILPSETSIFKAIKERGGRIVNYITDDPWNPIHRRRSFLRNLHHYDHIFCTKQAPYRRVEKAGTPSTSRLPFAYEPALHHPPLEKSKNQIAEVLFVGTGAAERLLWFDALHDLPEYGGVFMEITGEV